MLDEPFEDIPERNNPAYQFADLLVLLPTSLLCLAYWRLRACSKNPTLPRGGQA